MAKTMFEEWYGERLNKYTQDVSGMIQSQLESRFGPLGEGVKERLKSFSMDQLVQLGRALPNASSLKDLGLED